MAQTDIRFELFVAHEVESALIREFYCPTARRALPMPNDELEKDCGECRTTKAKHVLLHLLVFAFIENHFSHEVIDSDG